MSFPDTLCYEFSRHLEQTFAWSPPDLPASSHTCPSIVALSPSEIAQLGLRHSESTSTQNSDTQSGFTASSHPNERIYDLGTRNSQSFGFKRYSMDQTTSIDKFRHLQFDHTRHSTSNDTLLSAPSSSVLFSSMSHNSSFLCRERSSTENDSRPYAISQRRTSPNGNIAPRNAALHQPRSHPGLANDDTPSALDFHISTFPSLMTLDVQHPLAASQQERVNPAHPSWSDTRPCLQSSGTSELFSPLSTLSDINRQLIHFASPTFSLSRFPSSLSSPAFGSSEASGDATAFLPSNLGAGDIIVDMIPISDENSIPAHEAQQLDDTQRTRGRGQSKSITERIANLSGKLKRVLLKRIHSLKLQNNLRLLKKNVDSSSIVDKFQLSVPNMPPGLAAPLVSGADSAIRIATDQARTLPMISHAIPQNECQPANSMRRKFSLSLFARSSSVKFSSDTRKRKQARPKSMPDLSNQYPIKRTSVESYGSDNPNIIIASKRPKKLSLLFFKETTMIHAPQAE